MIDLEFKLLSPDLKFNVVLKVLIVMHDGFVRNWEMKISRN